MPDVSDEFDVVVSQGSAVATIVVTGELDLATSPRLAATLERAVADVSGDIVVDLSGVTFLDSTALTVLVTYRQQLAAVGRRLVAHAPSSVVVRVLTISGLLESLADPLLDGG